MILKSTQLWTFAVLIICFCVKTESASAPVASNPSAIEISLSDEHDSAIRLAARQASLGKILKQLADKTGARIHYSALPEAPVTATCAGANVRQIMECLLARQVGLVANKPEQDKPDEFWLLGSSVGSCQAISIEPELPKNTDITQPVQVPVSLEAQAEADEAVHEQSERLLKQAQSKDPFLRGEALNNLGAQGDKSDANVDEALRNGLSDKDASVRAQAITGIARRGGVEVADLLGQALKDQDVNVRMTAVSVVPDDATILQQALNDTDATIRSLAKDKLNDLAASQKRAENQ